MLSFDVWGSRRDGYDGSSIPEGVIVVGSYHAHGNFIIDYASGGIKIVGKSGDRSNSDSFWG